MTIDMLNQRRTEATDTAQTLGDRLAEAVAYCPLTDEESLELKHGLIDSATFSGMFRSGITIFDHVISTPDRFKCLC